MRLVEAMARVVGLGFKLLPYYLVGHGMYLAYQGGWIGVLGCFGVGVGAYYVASNSCTRSWRKRYDDVRAELINCKWVSLLCKAFFDQLAGRGEKHEG